LYFEGFTSVFSMYDICMISCFLLVDLASKVLKTCTLDDTNHFGTWWSISFFIIEWHIIVESHVVRRIEEKLNE